MSCFWYIDVVLLCNITAAENLVFVDLWLKALGLMHRWPQLVLLKGLLKHITWYDHTCIYDNENMWQIKFTLAWWAREQTHNPSLHRFIQSVCSWHVMMRIMLSSECFSTFFLHGKNGCRGGIFWGKSPFQRCGDAKLIKLKTVKKSISD